MSDESTTTNDEVEAHNFTEDLAEDLVENTLEAQDDEPDVEAHNFTENLTENLTENTME